METNGKKIEHFNKPIKCSTMGFEPLIFYIAHVHNITVASLPTEPPRIYMPGSLFIAKSVQLFYLQCYYFFLNELV